MRIGKGSLAVILLLGAGAAHAQTILKTEPPMGKLLEGQRVLVDDGRCPAGQISEVTGGNHTTVGGTKKIVRTRRCIPR